jgi:integrase
MANISIKIRKEQPNEKGEYILRLMITKNGKRKYISTEMWADSNYWDETQQQYIILDNIRSKEKKEANEERKAKNIVLSKIIDRANEVIREFDKNKIDWTLNQFEDNFNHKPVQGNISVYLKKHIKDLRETNHVGNANCYYATLHMMELFDERFSQRLFSEIDLKYVNRFDLWLQKRGCKGNTRRYYFKALRAIWNRAMSEKEAQPVAYPFGKGGFSVASLAEETEKRYLPTDYLTKLKDTKGQTPETEFARLLFLFSYYSYGMSFIDMALLTDKNVMKMDNGSYIVYKRQKVKHTANSKPIKILLSGEIERIIKHLSGISLPVSRYLLPIVLKQSASEEDLYSHVVNRRVWFGKHLKRLSVELELDFNLTSYVSRHTMAMQLQRNNVSETIISQVLNHADLKTTKTYLDSLDTSVIDEATRVL